MTAAPGAAAPPAVLLVDDRPENLLSLEAILATEGYTLVRAASGQAALQEVLRRDFAVILMDVAMPGIDGFEAAAMIKQRPRSLITPIIFVTASIYDVEHIYRGYTAGAVDYLYKPVSAAVVRAKVRVFANLYCQRDQIRRQGEALHERSRRERERLVARVEAALQASEARYDAASREAPFGVAVVDRGGRWRRANRWVCDALGYAQADLPNLPTLVSATAGGDLPTLLSLLQGDIPVLAREYPLIHRDGHVVWVSLTLSRFSDGQEDLTAVILEDVSARRAEEVFQRCLNHAGEMLLSELDCAHTLPQVAQLVVPALADWCAIDLLTEDGENTREVALAHAVADRRAGVVSRRTQWLAADPEAWRRPCIATHLDDEDSQDQAIAAGWLRGHDLALPCSLLRVPILAAHELLGTLTLASEQRARRFGAAELQFAHDLAHRCAFAIKSSRLYAASQAATRTRDDFISVASHELRTPLTPLRLQLQRLGGTARRRAAAFTEARRTEMIQGCVGQVARLGALVDNLFDVSHLHSGTLALERAPVDLAALTESVVARFVEGDMLAAPAQLEIASAAPATGEWDGSRVEQVIVNLLTNAVRYGRGRPIAVAVARRGEWAELRVRDQGIGIPEEKRGAIFQRFARGVAGSAYGGLGLGLYIVQEIVRAHGGQIEVESAVGVGSTFLVRLPLQVGGAAGDCGAGRA